MFYKSTISTYLCTFPFLTRFDIFKRVFCKFQSLFLQLSQICNIFLILSKADQQTDYVNCIICYITFFDSMWITSFYASHFTAHVIANIITYVLYYSFIIRLSCIYRALIIFLSYSYHFLSYIDHILIIYLSYIYCPIQLMSLQTFPEAFRIHIHFGNPNSMYSLPFCRKHLFVAVLHKPFI